MAANVLTAVVVVAAVMALINVLVIIRLRQRRKSDEEQADDYSLVNASRMVGGMFGLLGGFMVASLWGGQSELDGRFVDELASLTGLVSQIRITAPERGPEALQLAKDYLVAIRDDEVLGDDSYDRALRFTPSARAGAVVTSLERISTEISPKADRVFVSFLENRIGRLAWQPPISRISIVPAIAMVVLMVLLVGIQQPGPSSIGTWFAAVMSGVAIAVIATMVATLLNADIGDDRRADLLTSYLHTIG